MCLLKKCAWPGFVWPAPPTNREILNGLHRHHGDNTERMFRGWSEVWLQPGRRDWNMMAELSAIACPTLIIQGQDDEYGTRAQVDAIADGITGRKQKSCGYPVAAIHPTIRRGGPCWTSPGALSMSHALNCALLHL